MKPANVARWVVCLHALVALLLPATAYAADVACSGINLFTQLEKTDPALAQKVKAEAAGTMNGKGTLWKIESGGLPPSFLYGTMHVTDPRVTSLKPKARKAFNASQTVVIETTDVLNQAQMLASLMAQPDLMMFTDGSTIQSRLTLDDTAALEKALQDRGITLASVASMKPWIIAGMLALPACELARKAGGAEVLDVRLAKEAQASGKQLKGLETAAEQFEAMASLPMDFHLKGLIDTLRLDGRVDDATETMIRLYEDEDIGMFWPLLRYGIDKGGVQESGYSAFEQAMIINRNQTMVRNAAPILSKGGAFIATGALHLPGPDGLVEMLRKYGYTVSALD